MITSKNKKSFMSPLQNIEKAIDFNALKKSLAAIASGMGYDFYAVYVRLISNQKKNTSLYLLTNYPHCWLIEYENNNYIEVDPLFNIIKTTCLPIVWDDIIKDLSSVGHSPEIDVLNRAKAHGINSGVSIKSGSHGLMSFGSKKAHNEIRENIDSTLFLLAGVANCACERLGYLVGKENFGNVNLTRREMDCLLLSMQGMKASNIAEKLSMSDRTVYFHIKSIKEKFRASSTTEVLSKIVSSGISDKFLLPKCSVSIV